MGTPLCMRDRSREKNWYVGMFLFLHPCLILHLPFPLQRSDFWRFWRLHPCKRRTLVWNFPPAPWKKDYLWFSLKNCWIEVRIEPVKKNINWLKQNYQSGFERTEYGGWAPWRWCHTGNGVFVGDNSGGHGTK